MLSTFTSAYLIQQGDRVCLSITPAKGTIALFKNGCAQGVVFSDPALFAEPMRLAVSVFSPDINAVATHDVRMALVDAPSLLLRNFADYYAYHSQKAGSGASVAVPSDLSIAPLLFDDDEVAAFFAAVAQLETPPLRLVSAAVPKKDFLRIKEDMKQTAPDVLAPAFEGVSAAVAATESAGAISCMAGATIQVRWPKRDVGTVQTVEMWVRLPVAYDSSTLGETFESVRV
jgi:hypothetical protein